MAPLQGIVGKADALAGDVSNFTPTYSGATMQGIQGLQDAASNGSGAYQALSNVVPGSTQGFDTGLGQLQNVASGGMLNNNQYLNPVLRQAMTDTADKVNAQFTGAGRYGSGAHAQTLTRNLGQLENQALLQNYQTERGNQDTAAKTLYGGGFQGAGLGQQLDQSAINPALLNLQAGGLQDQIATSQRTAPMQALQWQSGITNPIAGLGGTTNQTQQAQTVQPTNWLTTGLGIGQMGLGMLSAPMTGGASLFGTAANPSLLGGMTGYWR